VTIGPLSDTAQVQNVLAVSDSFHDGTLLRCDLCHCPVIASSRAQGDAAGLAIPDWDICQRPPPESADNTISPLPCRAMYRKMSPRESM